MSAHIERVDLHLQTPRHRREAAAAFMRELRSALPEALAAAAAARGERGVAIVPVMRLTLRAPLARVRARDLARTIAEACLEAAATRSLVASEVAAGVHGKGERILDLLRTAEGVHCNGAAEEAAAWLVALALDERTVVRSASPFTELDRLPTSAAFVEVCARVGDARAVVRALGQNWAMRFALRCTPAEAMRLLSLLDDGVEPSAETRLRAERRFHERTEALPGPVRAAAAALALLFEDAAGAAAATRSALFAAERSALAPEFVSKPEADAPMASDLAGLWLLLPFLRAAHEDFDEGERRAVVLAVAEYLAGSDAGDDPALAACLGDVSLREVRAALPSHAKVARIAVAAIRAFARHLGYLRKPRCAYVLRAILCGPAMVRRREDGSFEATLPRSPLRVLLDRAGCIGPVAAPWRLPALEIVRDD